MKVEWVGFTNYVRRRQSQLYDVAAFDTVYAAFRHDDVGVDDTTCYLQQDWQRGRGVGDIVDVEPLS